MSDTPFTDSRTYGFTDEDGIHCEAVHADFARKLERQRNHWKRESLEQARLLAMSADREEKMRDALKYIAGLDTSQGTSPQQCSAVAVAMEALQ